MPEHTPSTEAASQEEAPPAEEPSRPEGEERSTDTEPVPAEVLRKELVEARGEAANYRVRLREVEARFTGAKTAAEFEAAVTELRTQNEALERQILRGTVAAKYELPTVLAKRLTGETPEELEADAKELQKLLGSPAPVSLGGGLTPPEPGDGFDPVKAARAARRRSY
ncbi:hypothetical protein [Streptomyces sp. NPDC047097]|uniref:hypothetical protein n=1 Tax=Streptomyces sp. NPDC047097 TaxID=3155260 RepID=UPI0033E28116